MVNEMKQTEDTDVISGLMWKTLPDRRRMLASSDMSWKVFFERYPQLLSEKEVCEPFW